MKLLGIFLLKRQDSAADPIICCSATDLSSFGYFQRSSVKEFMTFLARTVAKRVEPGMRTQITENENVVWCQATTVGVVGVAVGDKEYNSRVAFTMLSSVLNDFQDKFRGVNERGNAEDYFVRWPELNQILVKYQDPDEADKILRIKRDIEQTKVIMYDAIDAILERGEKIDGLVAKSEDLSQASKSFYKEAKRTNSCCAL